MNDSATNVENAYRAAVAGGRIEADPTQASALAALTRLERELTSRGSGWRRKTPRGVYLYGPVGRGKTWLMDLFYRKLQIENKLRAHFHVFMREEVHAPLRRLRDERDPLRRLARDLARRVRVLCFDELIVEDIADAMLLGPLFAALFAEGVALVATANVPPTELYRDGLQRERFLPTITALERHCEVILVGGERDYRAEHIGAAGTWRVIEPQAGRRELAELFLRLTGEPAEPRALPINGRAVAVAGVGADVLFVNFGELCGGPRNAADYLELAGRYSSLLLSDVPRLDDDTLDATRRFIALVDVLYEKRTVLVVAAAAQPGELYCGRRFRFEFLRTASRLKEMRSADWLRAAHLAHTVELTPL